MRKAAIAFALLVCLLLSGSGCGAKNSADKSAQALLESIPDKQYYALYDHRILAPDCMIPGSVCTETDGSDENGPYHSYEYAWKNPDVPALSEKFAAWIAILNETEGVGTEPYRNGTYYILVDGDRVGLAGSSRTDDEVRISVTLYTNVDP